MPRTTSLSSSSSADHYSKFEKTKKPFLPLPLSHQQPRRPLPIIVFSAFCLFVGVAGIAFSLFAVLRPKPLPVFRCGRTQDTFRSFYPLPTARRPKLLGFVGIQTAFSSSDRRAALRSTWFPSDPDALLRLAFFKAAFELFEADYYVKADDDIYLRPDRLATLLAKERSHSLTYIGCMKKGPVITDPKLKWYEKSGHLIGSEYFLHAYGPIYVLSAEVVGSLAIARNNRMFSNEDVTIGSWMLAMNVHHEDNRAICDPRCTPTSIAVWDIPKCSGLCNPATRMKELHKISMCSKSPTLPPDDR
ncbi:putative beta-1,3-galactosyltransferase 12 [Camellia lanceoleosa]|uniref:Beta-1,3-galactosyltransferase 12 n=1 Tax=Camellia lanceoleosa TaxID=1840588 RepID=A0ACC0FM10_9ERIC|nr:putative beta-1,3-galactosyltransferase 12 [Camellia lanceoleosa]